jgi:4-diphosphocytidyl-2-C-methyl-D-erythritol kinase
MVVFPNCKINIGLNIINKRNDGYHNLQTIFYPLALNDVLEIIEAPQQETGIHFSATGIPVPGDVDTNLCIKAYHLLKKDFPQLPCIKMHLHKAIPMGAGLGGGSADAAFALQLLNKKFALEIANEKLMDYALQLGSDCPFFILNKASFATGRGEILRPITMDLSVYKIFLINPGIHVSTALAFSQVKVEENKENLQELIMLPINQWKERIGNDFEKPVFEAYPELSSIKNELYNKGALYASMSGSGSSLYGIFAAGDAPFMDFPAHYFQRWV